MMVLKNQNYYQLSVVVVELHALIVTHVAADSLSNPHGLDKVLDDRVSLQYELGED